MPLQDLIHASKLHKKRLTNLFSHQQGIKKVPRVIKKESKRPLSA